MRKITFIALILVFLSGCATSPLQARKAAIVDCTKDFMDYEAHVIDASTACMNILGRKDTGHASSTDIHRVARSASD